MTTWREVRDEFRRLDREWTVVRHEYSYGTVTWQWRDQGARQNAEQLRHVAKLAGSYILESVPGNITIGDPDDESRWWMYVGKDCGAFQIGETIYIGETEDTLHVLRSELIIPDARSASDRACDALMRVAERNQELDREIAQNFADIAILSDKMKSRQVPPLEVTLAQMSWLLGNQPTSHRMQTVSSDNPDDPLPDPTNKRIRPYQYLYCSLASWVQRRFKNAVVPSESVAREQLSSHV